MVVRLVNARLLPRVVRLTWSDSHESCFHHSWLRDHCLQSLHPVSRQRELPLTSVLPGIAPERVELLDESAGGMPRGQEMHITWPATVEATGVAHSSIFPADWLRSNCYNKTATWDPARTEVPTSAPLTLWGPATPEQHGVVAWSGLRSGGGERSEIRAPSLPPSRQTTRRCT